ncbi:MAG: hypothetical protein IKD36_02480 [Clostridia bacterium]|nr:hypothetical protein [Clostridia bacterium]
MLVNNVNGEAVGASMVRDSEFYIELAKFVQAYTVIIGNPNEFLAEVGEPSIDEKKGRVTWGQLVKIITTCDFGFLTVPTEVDLKVFYNYALEIGSLDSVNQKIATVSDIAEAQKHYYNFVDKAKDKAETEYQKQHRIYENRESEMRNADNELSKLKGVCVFAYIMMLFSVTVSVFGIISCLANNIVARTVGSFIPVWEEQYVGAIILIVFGALLFFLFDKLHEKFKRKHFHLVQATETIFTRGNESYENEIYLKRKLNNLTKQLKIVQAELNDKHKKFDVQENINRLKATNKYYQKYAENEETFASTVETSAKSVDDEKNLRPEDFAPVVLTREQEENLRRVGKQAITLEGQYDLEAYKEKFEKSREKEVKQEKQEEVKQEKQEEQAEQTKRAQEEQREFTEAQLKMQEQELLDSIDYIKEILGFSNDDELEKSQ